MPTGADLRQTGVSMNGCEMVKCTSFKEGKCQYESDTCKYQEKPNLAPKTPVQTAWEEIKKACGTEKWTVSESTTYFGFFLHGWYAGREFAEGTEQLNQAD
jgi:hypothetical protein